MERIFIVATPVCPYHPGRKVGGRDCMQCDNFRGGIVPNFVDCTHPKPEPAKRATKVKKGVQKRATKTRKK